MTTAMRRGVEGRPARPALRGDDLSIADLPWFPAWGVVFDEPVADPAPIIESWMRERRDERWLILAGPAAASERHLWSVWLALRDRLRGGTAVARSIDAEFLRILSGTHQIRIAFERAGLQAGDETAWLVHLPDPLADESRFEGASADSSEGGEGDAPKSEGATRAFDAADHLLPGVDFVADAAEAARLMTWIGADLLPARPIPTLAGLQRIAAADSADRGSLPSDPEPDDPPLSDLEERFISHAVTCDLN